MITLGLDASTKTIGYGVVKNNTEIIEIGFFDISIYDTHKEKAYAFINFIKNKSWGADITQINIEAALNGFAGGKTSQQTIITLIRWSAVFCYILEEEFKIVVVLCGASTMRKQLFGKALIKGMKSKAYVKQQIEARFDVSSWLIYNNSGKNKKIKKIDIRNQDAYDGLVAAFYKI